MKVVLNWSTLSFFIWWHTVLFCRIFQLLITVVIQYFLMRDLEKLTGSLRIAVIYMGSGVAGNLASAIFVPYRADVSILNENCNRVMWHADNIIQYSWWPTLCLLSSLSMSLDRASMLPSAFLCHNNASTEKHSLVALQSIIKDLHVKYICGTWQSLWLLTEVSS